MKKFLIFPVLMGILIFSGCGKTEEKIVEEIKVQGGEIIEENLETDKEETEKVYNDEVIKKEEVKSSKENDVLNEESNELGDWETYEDEEYGFKIKHPKNCRIAGAPGNINVGIDCSKEISDSAYILFNEVSVNSLFGYDVSPELALNFDDFSIEKIVNIFYKVNKSEQDRYPDRNLSEVSKFLLNGKTAYKFNIDTAYCSNVNEEDYSCGGGGRIDFLSALVFIESDDKKHKLKLEAPKEDDTAQKMLNSFEFIK